MSRRSLKNAFRSRAILLDHQWDLVIDALSIWQDCILADGQVAEDDRRDFQQLERVKIQLRKQTGARGDL